MRWLLGWVPTAFAAIGGLVMLVEAWVATGLGWTAEDHGVQGLFRRLAMHGWPGVWKQGAGSYRPLCGSLLLLQDELGLSLPLRYLFSDLLHAVNVALAGVLVGRLRGREAGWVTFGLGGLWSTDAEVSLWLGARCDVLVVLLGLLGAHAVLAGTEEERRLPGWALVAALAALLASLTKETGWALPIAWAPLAWRAAGVRWALLWPSAVAVVLSLAPRVFTLPSVLGPYIEHYAEPDPLRAVRMTVRSLGQLGLGDAVPDWHGLLVVGAGVTCSLVWVVWRGCRPSRGQCLVFGAAFLSVLGPAAVKVAPRTLYPVVLMLACLLGWAWPCIRQRPRALVWLCCVGLWQAGSSVAVARQWRRAHQERAEAVQVLAAQLEAGADLVLLGERNRFQRRLLGPPVAADLQGPGPLGFACIPQPHEHYDFAWNVQGPRALLVEGELAGTGRCRWRFALKDHECDPRRHRPTLGPVRVERIEGDAAVELTLEPGQPVAALWLDADGLLHRTSLRCDAQPEGQGDVSGAAEPR